ncbi:MAG: hypothetical protein AAFW46_02795 [Pseudomonadota bacterium]
MLVKFLTMLVVFGAGAYLLRRAFLRPPPNPQAAATLEPCPRCGDYRAAGDLCACERFPTP